jgi:hypothetical protein
MERAAGAGGDEDVAAICVHGDGPVLVGAENRGAAGVEPIERRGCRMSKPIPASGADDRDARREGA